MSTHEPGLEPERADGPVDATQRLDPVAPPEARDGGTHVLPTGAEPSGVEPSGVEPSGVESLWDLGAPEAAPSPAAPGPLPAEPSPVASSLGAPSAAGESAAETSSPGPARRGRRAVRVGTVVWGLVVAACGVLALAAAGGASIDGGTVAIAILGGAGVALVLGSIVTGVRRRDRV